jgi:3-hydroxybutyryl-CoA dehydratase
MLEVGQTAELSRTVRDADILAYAELTGDFNPAHTDEAWAATSCFGGRVAHGMLTAGYVSAVLAMRLPGPGAIYLGQTLRFTRPVRPGDTVTARVEVVEVLLERRRARLATTCRNQHGETVLEGEATVLLAEPAVRP